MRRHILLIVLIMTGVTGLVSGQGETPAEPEPILVAPEPGTPPVFGPLTGMWTDSVEVEAEQVPPPLLTQNHASDSCSDAPLLGLQTFGNAGADTLERTLSPNEYQRTWYRQNPPLPQMRPRLETKTSSRPSGDQVGESSWSKRL